MNWKRKLHGLTDCTVLRVRPQGPFSAEAFEERVVPLRAPQPSHSGYARRWLPTHYIYVVGTNAQGQETHVCCGLFSEDLLAHVNEAIKTTSEPTSGAYG